MAFDDSNNTSTSEENTSYLGLVILIFDGLILFSIGVALFNGYGVLPALCAIPFLILPIIIMFFKSLKTDGLSSSFIDIIVPYFIGSVVLGLVVVVVFKALVFVFALFLFILQSPTFSYFIYMVSILMAIIEVIFLYTVCYFLNKFKPKVVMENFVYVSLGYATNLSIYSIGLLSISTPEDYVKLILNVISLFVVNTLLGYILGTINFTEYKDNSQTAIRNFLVTLIIRILYSFGSYHILAYQIAAIFLSKEKFTYDFPFFIIDIIVMFILIGYVIYNRKKSKSNYKDYSEVLPL